MPLQPTSQWLCEVAASLTFLREINVQIRTKLSAGVLPPSCKTARYGQVCSHTHLISKLLKLSNYRRNFLLLTHAFSLLGGGRVTKWKMALAIFHFVRFCKSQLLSGASVGKSKIITANIGWTFYNFLRIKCLRGNLPLFSCVRLALRYELANTATTTRESDRLKSRI